MSLSKLTNQHGLFYGLPSPATDPGQGLNKGLVFLTRPYLSQDHILTTSFNGKHPHITVNQDKTRAFRDSNYRNDLSVAFYRMDK